jgi:hypothetical protein
MLILDFEKRKVVKEKTINVGKNQLLNYEAAVDCFDFYKNKIIFSPSGTDLISVYDLKFRKNIEIRLPFYLSTNISDTINKYLPDNFVKENIYSPKEIIKIMGEKYGKNIFKMQQIRSVKLLNDSVVIAVVNNLKMDFYKENVVYVINLNTKKITRSIENLPINNFTYDLPKAYYRGLSGNGKDFVILRNEKFNNESNSIDSQYNIYERLNINSFIDNSLDINMSTYFVYDYKKAPVKVSIDSFDEYVIMDEYNCKSCIFDKTKKTLFISTNMSSIVDNFKLVQSYKKEYPKSELYFINPKYYNTELLLNQVNEIKNTKL